MRGMSGSEYRAHRARTLALFENKETAAHSAGDELGELEAQFTRCILAAAADVAERALASGKHPSLVIRAISAGFGHAVAAIVIPLTDPGRSGAGVGIVVPALSDIARDFARIQDERAMEKEQGRLFS